MAPLKVNFLKSRRRCLVTPVSVVLALALLYYVYGLYLISSEYQTSFFHGFSEATLSRIHKAIKTSSTNIVWSSTDVVTTSWTSTSEEENKAFVDMVQKKWKLHGLDEPKFTTVEGYDYEIDPDNHHWTKPLKERILIIDIDSRVNDTEGEILAEPPLSKKTIKAGTAGMLNHFLYALIHGYDYRLVKPPSDPKRHGTWSKVSVMKEALKTHEFVVFLDSDANLQYYNLPYEWLMNLWNVTTDTLVAMPEDPNSPVNQDSNGWVLWNTGFMTGQRSARTQELFNRWDSCTSGKRYPGCAHWDYDWAHEQAAFGHYVRYDYEVGKDIVPISCMDGNGANYIFDKKCGGVFVSHHWGSKKKVKEQFYDQLDDYFVADLHKYFYANVNKYYVDLSNATYPFRNITI